MYLCKQMQKETAVLVNNYQKVLVPSVGGCKRAFEVDADAFPRLSGSNQLISWRLIKSRF